MTYAIGWVGRSHVSSCGQQKKMNTHFGDVKRL